MLNLDSNALTKISYGLFIITANENDFDNGCIINTAGQVTDTPKKIFAAVNKKSKTHDMIKNTGKFNICVISEKADFELFNHFGFQSGHNVDKLKSYKEAKRSENGLLYITNGTNAFISGRVTDKLDLGTHTLFIAEVTDGEVLTDKPTATYEYYHRHIKKLPKKKSKKTVWRCKVCGYEYEGEELPQDFICPLCNHPASDFEMIEI